MGAAEGGEEAEADGEDHVEDRLEGLARFGEQERFQLEGREGGVPADEPGEDSGAERGRQ